MTQRRSIGPLGVLMVILVPVVILMLLASRYPSMIERRVEARKVQQRPAQAGAQPAGTALEIIMPDGKRLKEGSYEGGYQTGSALQSK